MEEGIFVDPIERMYNSVFRRLSIQYIYPYLSSMVLMLAVGYINDRTDAMRIANAAENCGRDRPKPPLTCTCVSTMITGRDCVRVADSPGTSTPGAFDHSASAPQHLQLTSKLIATMSTRGLHQR